VYSGPLPLTRITKNKMAEILIVNKLKNPNWNKREPSGTIFITSIARIIDNEINAAIIGNEAHNENAPLGVCFKIDKYDSNILDFPLKLLTIYS